MKAHVILLFWRAFFCCNLAFFPGMALAQELVEVKKIWSQAHHNAFTDVTRYNNRWYCVFREATNHLSFDGKGRVITSLDGVTWTSAALLSAPANGDLRDPKITITPDNRLMFTSWERFSSGSFGGTSVRFSTDGTEWTAPVKISDQWLWRVTWHRGTAYGVAYYQGPLRLLSSTDGVHFTVLVDNFNGGQGGEATIRFIEADTAVCLLRDGCTNGAMVGLASPPYTNWSWKCAPVVPMGGPDFIILPDNRIVAGGRFPWLTMSLGWLDIHQGTLTTFRSLPSGGDTSYPGFYWYDGLLWVTYYSGAQGETDEHTTPADIYLATLRFVGLTDSTTVAIPAIFPQGGSFIDEVTVTLSTTTAGASIRYTADGSTPTGFSALYTSPLILTATTTVKAMGTKSGMGNSSITSAVFTKRDTSIPYQVNCGDGEVPPFNADALYSGGTVDTVTADITTSGVANTAPAAVYQSARYGSFSYTLTGLPAGGEYTVRLHFAELSNSTPGSRIFHILINGKMAQPNLDIFSVTGAMNQALVKEYKTPADGGRQVTIGFVPVVGNAVCNGIELLKSPTRISYPADREAVKNRLDILPNPVTREVLGRLAGPEEVTLYNLSGTTVGPDRSMANGVYIFRAQGQATREIVITE